jgi:Tfp pilus assembly protein PilO
MPYNYKTEIQRYRRYYQNLEPMLQKPKGKVYTTIVFSFLAVSLFGWYAIRPTVQTILYLRREIQDKTEINKKMEDKITSLIEAQANYEQVSQQIQSVYQALPETPKPAELIIQLRNLASASGVMISSLQLPTVPLLGQEATPGAAKAISKTDPAKPSGKQGEVSLTMAIRGSYEAIRSYLDGIINMRRVVWIEDMSILPARDESLRASDSATPQGSFLQLVLKLKGYYLVP